MASTDKELLRLRDSIDNIDAALIHLLAERFKCTQTVGRFKAEHKLPPADPKREAKQIARLRKLAHEAKLDPASTTEFSAEGRIPRRATEVDAVGDFEIGELNDPASLGRSSDYDSRYGSCRHVGRDNYRGRDDCASCANDGHCPNSRPDTHRRHRRN